MLVAYGHHDRLLPEPFACNLPRVEEIGGRKPLATRQLHLKQT
jgi:hypothetical protein